MRLISKNNVIFVANRAFSLYSSRKLLMQKLMVKDWNVIALTTIDEYSSKLEKIGVQIEELKVDRGGFSPIKDMRTLSRIIQVYNKYKPYLIHQFHAKPVIMGNLAKMIVTRSSKLVNTITGLGYSFVAGGITKKLASLGYNFFLRGSNKTIFQNRDDMQLFLDNNWLNKDQAELVVSSGINLGKFEFKENKFNGKIKILMVTRLLWQKGVKEYIEAAEVVKNQYSNVEFQLGGEIDDNHPNAVPKNYIDNAKNEKLINFIGYVDNMPEKLKDIDIFVLPSYYREGVPRVLLEASATGKAIITTDSPGCREAVIHNQTGKMVPPKDSNKLAQAILDLLENKDLIKKMGIKGRERIEKEFDIRVITEKYLDVYRELGLEV